jgi:hypothetical protein
MTCITSSSSSTKSTVYLSILPTPYICISIFYYNKYLKKEPEQCPALFPNSTAARLQAQFISSAHISDSQVLLPRG